MTKASRRYRGWLLGMGLSLCLQAAVAAPWEEKFPAAEGLLDTNGQLLDRNGAVLSDRGGNALVPNCAFGDETPTGPFRFLVQRGDPERLLIIHDGGGSCWENNTCGSVFVSPLPSYDPLITETPASLEAAGGVLSAVDDANPFKTWTKIFIPYCTADIGWGNKVSTYTAPGVGEFQVHHRGYANIRTTLRWVENEYRGRSAPTKLVVAGMSAGGYAAPGVLLPEVRRLFPHASTKTYMLADSANGIVTDPFLADSRVAWGYANTIPTYLLREVGRGANMLPARFYLALASRFPATRLGQFQNAFDIGEALFLNTMLYVDDPLKWEDPAFLGPTVQLWSLKAQLSTLITSVLPNYRFYTAAGTEHTVLVYTPPEAGQGFCSDDFYTESSANGLSFRNWLNSMVNDAVVGPASSWRNASCFPNCLAPSKPGCP